VTRLVARSQIRPSKPVKIMTRSIHPPARVRNLIIAKKGSKPLNHPSMPVGIEVSRVVFNDHASSAILTSNTDIFTPKKFYLGTQVKTFIAYQAHEH
jgi:hypothetical protein